LFFTGYTKLDDQMFPAKLARYLLLFLDEMDTYSGRFQALIKSLITQPVIKIRPLFSCFDQQYPRIASLAAAINHENFLNDLSGSRRYLVIEVKEIDHNHHVSMNKVLAQAFALAKTPEYKDYFNSEEIEALEERNEQFKIKSDVEVLISQYYEACLENDIAARFMTATQIMNELKNKSELKPRYSVHFVGSVMRKLGFVRSHIGSGRDKRFVYVVKERE
jgi:predicted P-loop ATPase